ncbi:SNF2 family helicase/ATPase [Trichophyton tonsurans CBS 112818]|uniref:DNA helicase n=1 Tax=Trichophyton tonsurans (strain CBS 112818) TaxID=647933 RepID=F2S748_TRIT1|nr:SNF2 family helicase/ATPase [Trichophyton tonsurans CBS 112818]
MEDRIPDTPIRNMTAARRALNIDHEPVSDTRETLEQGTIATIPLNGEHSILAPTQPTQLLTQPTQVIQPPNHSKASPQHDAVVQVAGSSPLGPSLQGTNRNFSASIAPPGTHFRPPAFSTGPVRRMPVIDLSEDDGPTYRGGSSDDDFSAVRTTDIRPSTFAKAAPSPEKDGYISSPVSASGNSLAKFREITAAAFYSPDGTNGQKRSAENANITKTSASEMANKRNRTTPPASDHHGFTLNQIDDFTLKTKVKRLCSVYPNKSVRFCLDTLMQHRGNYQHALEYIANLEEKSSINLTSEDELSLDCSLPRVSAVKQQIKSKGRIQDKWTSSQQPISSRRESEDKPQAPRRRLIRGSKSRQESSADTAVSDQSASRNPLKKTVIRGKGRPASPRIPLEDDCSSDSEAESLSPDDGSQEAKVLEFFNICSPDDLSDIAEITVDVANEFISQRPFSSLASARCVSIEQSDTSEKKPGNKKKISKKALGDKIVDKCLDMWTGYEAVDALVAECEALGKPIATEIKRWGVDIFGSKRDGGELEIVSLDKPSSDGIQDSGIGSPSSRCCASEDADDVRDKSRGRKFISQPSIMSDTITMKDYQIVGINWLKLIYDQGLSCILADDMGLGKTCQVIAFLSHLLEVGVTGPHLVVVPASTLENWLREFSLFCPKLKTMPYYAGQAARAEIRTEIEDNRENINVVITTYTIAKAKVDAAFLRSMNFNVCVYDEGHMLKSSKSQLYEKLIRIPAQFRLLLTGTPLQNNLQELASLLGFILPSVFRERKDDLEYIFRAKARTVDDTHAALLSAQRIARAKSMLMPFVLRRKKHQVIDLPAKVSRVEYCEMNESQKEIYHSEIESVKQHIADRAAGKKLTRNKSSNILMKLRQAAIHPLFSRRIYDDKTLSRISKACLKDEKWTHSDPDQIYVELREYNDFECHTLCTGSPAALGKFALKNKEWMNSGKVDKLCELLDNYIANGDRILVFSQFTMVMDILEQVLETQKIKFFRLDGKTSVEDRQSILDAFHEQVDIPVFMLSTKAGGAGINLACANKVIIFDSSFNPQEDIQAENRAHRVGQTREVEVVRLVTRGTIEEQIHALGQTKLALDQRVAGEDGDAQFGGKRDDENLKAVEELVMSTLELEQAPEEIS